MCVFVLRLPVAPILLRSILDVKYDREGSPLVRTERFGMIDSLAGSIDLSYDY